MEDKNKFGSVVPEESRNEKFVIYSAVEDMASDDHAGYWSNEDGWTIIDCATLFSKDESMESRLPIVADGDDAIWMSYKKASSAAKNIIDLPKVIFDAFDDTTSSRVIFNSSEDEAAVMRRLFLDFGEKAAEYLPQIKFVIIVSDVEKSVSKNAVVKGDESPWKDAGVVRLLAFPNSIVADGNKDYVALYERGTGWLLDEDNFSNNLLARRENLSNGFHNGKIEPPSDESFVAIPRVMVTDDFGNKFVIVEASKGTVAAVPLQDNSGDTNQMIDSLSNINRVDGVWCISKIHNLPMQNKDNTVNNSCAMVL